MIPGLGRSIGEGIGYPLQYSWASLIAQLIKNLLEMWETWIRPLGGGKGTATHLVKHNETRCNKIELCLYEIFLIFIFLRKFPSYLYIISQYGLTINLFICIQRIKIKSQDKTTKKKACKQYNLHGMLFRILLNT